MRKGRLREKTGGGSRGGKGEEGKSVLGAEQGNVWVRCIGKDQQEIRLSRARLSEK